MSELIRKIDILMNGVSMSRVESVREIRDEVTALEAQLKEREWISVEDRFPQLQSDETMLVAASGRIYAVDWEAEYCEFEQMNSSITHWQPLPSPPAITEQG